MDNKEYLNEEKYQKSVKGLKRASLIVLLVGVFIGLALIITGIVLYNNDKTTPLGETGDRIKNSITKKYTKEEIDNSKEEYEKIKKEISSLEEELKTLNTKKDEIMENFSFSTDMNEVNKIITSITEKTKELAEKNSNKAILETKIYGKAKVDQVPVENEEGLDTFLSIFNFAGNQVDKGYRFVKYSPFFMFGGFIIFVSVLVSIVLFVISKRREITAFKVQQEMPIIKEAASEMAPTAGEVSKEIAKGVKEGLEEKE